MYRKGAYITARVVGLVVILVLGILLAVQTPFVQTRIARVALNRISERLQGNISCESAQVLPSGRLLLKGIVILDSDPYTEDKYNMGWERVDTILRIRILSTDFSIKSLFDPNGIHLGRVYVDGFYGHIAKDPTVYRSNLNRLQGKIPSDSAVVKKESKGKVSADKIIITDTRFGLTSFNARKLPFRGRGIDFANLDVSSEKIVARHFNFTNGRISATIDTLNAKEHSGYIISNLSADFVSERGKLKFDKVHIEDPWSDVHLKHLSFTAKKSTDWRAFLRDIQLEGEFEKSLISLEGVKYFDPARWGSTSLLELQGLSFHGPGTDVFIDDINLTDLHSGTRISGLDCHLIGFPPAFKMEKKLDVRLGSLQGTSGQISEFLSDLTHSKIRLANVLPDIPISLRLNAKGTLSELKLQAALNGAGEASADLVLSKLIRGEGPVEMAGSIETSDFRLGKAIGVTQIGKCGLRAKVSAVFERGNPAVKIDTLDISKIEFLGKKFSDIGISVNLSDEILLAKLISRDPKFRCNFNLGANLSEENNSYRFRGNVTKLDLAALELRIAESLSDLSLRVNADLSRHDGTLSGIATVDNVSFARADRKQDMGKLDLNFYTLGSEQCLLVEAPYLRAQIIGNGDVTDLLEALQRSTLRRELPSLYAKPSAMVPEGKRYSIDLKTRDTRDLFSFILPGVYVAEGTRIEASLNKNHELTGKILSDRLALGTNYLRGVDVTFDNLSGSLNLDAKFREFHILSYDIASPQLSANASNDTAYLHLAYGDKAERAADIRLKGQLLRDPETNEFTAKIHPEKSWISTGDQLWRLSEREIGLHGKTLSIDNFTLSSLGQSISADGGLSLEREDTLALKVQNVDLAFFNSLLPKQLDIKAVANAEASILSSPQSETSLQVELGLDSLSIRGVDVGNVRFSALRHSDSDDLTLYLRNEKGGHSAIWGSGSYYPRDGRTGIGLSFDQLSLEPLQPFFESTFNKMGGKLDGRIYLSRRDGEISLTSDNLRLSDAFVGLELTGTSYTLNGPIDISPSELRLYDLSVKDDSGGSASVDGSLKRRPDSKELDLDLVASLDALKVVDASERDGKPVYGLVYVNGDAKVQGPLSSLGVTLDVATTGKSNIHVPTSSHLVSKSSDILTFTKEEVPVDPYEEMLKGLRVAKSKSGELDLQASINIHNALKTFVEIDRTAGNVASFTGEGNIGVHLRPSKSILELSGDYAIADGNYQFVLPGILSRDFSIQEGSSIRFGGDLQNTSLDISAIYNVKANLNTIVADSTAVGTRRNIECGIKISDRLRNPQVDFSINIPDLEPTTRSAVESALNTPDKVQKQFMALLLMGSFIPDENSGIINSSDILLSNATELMMGQVNSILQRLDIPLDIGVGYQGLQNKTNSFDVAISTQLFNNRVIVGGSVANKKYKSSPHNGDIVGDLDIQIKLDKEGKFRLNLFSHSADEYSSVLDLSQRNGLGLSYQKEHSSLRDFFRRTSPRKKRSRKAAKDSTETTKNIRPAKAPVEQVTIKITGDD